MSRHKPKSRNRSEAVTAPASREELAFKALDAGRFREATEAFKELLKTERRADWVEALASAYAGRAAELQAKNMIPEALTIWRNRATACGKPLTEPAYIDCLCLSGATGEAFKLVAAIGDPVARAAVEAQLAAKALTLSVDALSVLPADSLLRRHHGVAIAALSAYGIGDADVLETALREIPFRSPYRDLRPILKALDSVQKNPAQAGELLVRVGADSPFAQLAVVVRIAALPDDEWLPALAGVDGAGQKLLLDLKGCPEAQRPQLLEFARLGQTPAAEKALAILLRSGGRLSPGAGALCRRLMPFALNRTRESSEYLKRLPPFEAARIIALNTELANQGSVNPELWTRAIAQLGKSGDEAKIAAMVLHRLALCDNTSAPEEKLSTKEIKWLEQSLELDADNRVGRLYLTRAYVEQGELKLARQQLEIALEAAPNDTETLLAAVETALAGESHKKAVGFAKRLLELDPINPKVRGLIGQAGLAQARKQIRAKRPDLAVKELDQALPWLADKDGRRVVGLLRGLCAHDTTTDALLRDAVAGFAGPLTAGFCLAMEAYRLKLEPHKVFNRVYLKKNVKPDAVDLAEFVRVLNAAGDKDEKIITKSLDYLRNLIELAAANPLSEEERIAACEALLRREEFMALHVHARAALKRSPQRPILIYFAAVAAFEDMPLPVAEIHKLETAYAQAKKDGDHRTEHRIADLLHQDADGYDDDPFGSEPFGMDESHRRAMIQMMIKMMGRKTFLNMIRQGFGAAVFNQLKAQAGNDEQRLIDVAIDFFLLNGGGHEQLLSSGFGGMPLPPPNPLRPPAIPPKTTPPNAVDKPQKGLFDD